MISEKNYDIGFSPSKVFMSDNPIRSKLYCRVFIDKIGEGTWEVVNENEYDVINDSIVFSEFPIGKFLSMQVSTTPAELMQSPTENTIIVSIKNEIKEVANVAGNIITVADSIDDLGVVSDNITKVQTVSDSITNVNNVGNSIVKVNTVSDSIVKVNNVSDNITKVDVVASNVLDIQTVASNIVDVQNAEENANSALLSKNLAEKWASELEDVPVSDGKYSAYHWALKSFEVVSGGIIDDIAPSIIKTYSSNKIEAIINALDLSDIEETVTLKHFTATLLNKLNGIEENANNYTHPASHPASMIDESVARRFVSDTEKSTWNGKQDALVSGTNIKTINSSSILGSEDILVMDSISNQSVDGVKTFTSSPIVPTASAQDNSTKVATTAYVDGKMVLGTAVNSTSGTSIDFTNIPIWVNKITVMFNGVSTNGSSPVQIKLGDSGGIESTGYLASGSTIAGNVQTSNYTSGFVAGHTMQGASFMRHGLFNILKVSNNTWCCSAVLGQSDDAQTLIGGGSKTLSATLDRLRITTVTGTSTFDAGQINIMYEG